MCPIHGLLPCKQQDDLLSLGQLIICLACNSLASLQDIPTAMEFIGRSYPAASAADLQKVIMYLYVRVVAGLRVFYACAHA